MESCVGGKVVYWHSCNEGVAVRVGYMPVLLHTHHVAGVAAGLPSN